MHTEAEEHLRVIRSLMEKATVYRAISAPTALVGGLLTTLTAIGLMFSVASQRAADLDLNIAIAMSPPAAMWPYFVVLGLTAGANTFFLWKDSQARREAFISSGMRLALRNLLPSMLLGGVVTIASVSAPALAISWIGIYGLGLLATQSFAPKSIAWLGWAFLCSALIVPICLMFNHRMKFEWISNAQFPHIAMLVTFGLFHLIYAACTWPRNADKTLAEAAP